VSNSRGSLQYLVPLSKVSKIQGGFAFKSKEYQNQGIPIVRISNVKVNGLDWSNTVYWTNDLPEFLKKYLLKPQDILISMTGEVGVTAQVQSSDIPSLLNQRVGRFVINVNSLVDPDFLFYVTQSLDFINDIRAAAFGAIQLNISADRIEKVYIPLPPFDEQIAISRILKATQAAIQARRDELELERERKAALMQYLFMHGTRGDTTKQTEIGEMPESWKVVQLQELLREPLKNGYSARESNTKEGIRTLTLSAVTQNDFSIKNTKLTVAESHKVQNLWLQAGDIFIERGNTFEFVGLAALYEGPENFAIYSDLLIRVRLKRECMIPGFAVEFLLSDPCRAYFRKNATGTAGNMPKIDHGTVGRIPLPLPSLTEQSEIAEVSRVCDIKIAALEQEISLHEELFRTFLEELMTGQLSTLPLIEEGGTHE
jgi:type I restriction enzyme S subunit